MRAFCARPAPGNLAKVGRPGLSRRHVATLPKKVHRCQASAAGAGSDPHSVLGIPPDANSAQIEKAYRSKRRQAEIAGDREALKVLEEAHNAVFMAALNTRLAGKGPIDKKVQKADRVDIAPWRPKVFRASDLTLKWAGGVYGAILVFNFLLKAAPQGVEATCIAAVVLNCWKQYQIFPTDQFGELQKRLEGGWRNLFRGALLTILATVLGVVLFWSAPDLLSEALGMRLPVAFYESQGALLTVGALLCNFLCTAFIR
eukprot:jgi/Ulvmu1/8675/UM047_0013.1